VPIFVKQRVPIVSLVHFALNPLRSSLYYAAGIVLTRNQPQLPTTCRQSLHAAEFSVRVFVVLDNPGTFCTLFHSQHHIAHTIRFPVLLDAASLIAPPPLVCTPCIRQRLCSACHIARIAFWIVVYGIRRMSSPCLCRLDCQYAVTALCTLAVMFPLASDANIPRHQISVILTSLSAFLCADGIGTGVECHVHQRFH